jgi:hypothetical protein
MRKNKIKEMMKAGKPVINGWLANTKHSFS